MIKKEEIVSILSEMEGRLNNLSSSDKLFIENLYKIVLGRLFTRTSCGDCYKDAIIQMYNYLQKNEIMTKKSNYILKAGVIIMIPGDANIYNNHNLTDKVAENFLKDKPNAINLFEVYPEDQEAKVTATNDEVKIVKRRLKKNNDSYLGEVEQE